MFPLLMLAPALADAQSAVGIPDFSGAWRLDDSHSGNADSIQGLLRQEVRKETSPAAAASSAIPAANPYGNPVAGNGDHGQHGGMGGGGMGGHGHRGNRHAGASDGNDKPAGPTAYPLPPMLKDDGVLLVQRHGGGLEIQLADGTRLDAMGDDRERPLPDDSAMVRYRHDGSTLQITLRYADGSMLDERWEHSRTAMA